MNDSSPKYQIIYEIMSAKDNVLNVKELCRVAGVSRSGYDAWLKAESKRRERDNEHLWRGDLKPVISRPLTTSTVCLQSLK